MSKPIMILNSMRMSSAWFQFLWILILCSCNNDAKEKLPDNPIRTDTQPETTAVHHEKTETIKFRIKPVSFLDSVDNHAHAESILALNRVNRRNLRRYDSILVPDTLSDDILLYSPFPSKIKMPDAHPDLILVSIRLQAFSVYDSSGQVRWGPVSTGKASTPTPSGVYHTNWKAKKTISTENPEWILPWYFNIDNFRGISFHEYDLPGFPASHACIRMRKEDAKWLYSWARQWKLTEQGEILEYGTPVIIYGSYHFREKQPWHSLKIYQRELEVDRHELDSVLRVYRKNLLKESLPDV